MITKQLRYNTDIKWIVIHHTTNSDGRSGNTVNSNYQKSGYFGNPYDITINTDGTIDLSSIWTYQSNASTVYSNAKITDITRYSTHYLSGAGENYNYNKYAIHIALAGNFDISRPLSAQTNTLINVLNQILNFYQIDPKMYLYYHSDFVNTSCPGIQMLPKSQLIAALTYTLLPYFSIQKNDVNVVIDPFFINFVGDNVTVTLLNDTVTVTYNFDTGGLIPPKTLLDTSLVVTVDAVCC